MEWLAYTVDVQSAGTYSVKLRVASEGSGGNVYLDLNGERLTQNTAIPGTGNSQNWQDVELNGIELSSGVQTLFLRINQGGFNLNYMELIQDQVTAIDELNLVSYTIFPNPFKEVLNIQLKDN